MREAAAASTDASATDRVAAGAVAFARRALANPRLAWALLAEPVDPAVEAERLHFRHSYRDVLATVIADGVGSGELPEQDPEADRRRARRRDRRGDGRAALPRRRRRPDAAIESLVNFCVRSIPERNPLMSTLDVMNTQPSPTHEVTNQAPPLADYNIFEANTVLKEAVEREGADWAADRTRALGEYCGRRRRDRARLPGQREPAEAEDPRPLRQPHRRGRVPPGLARAAGARRRQRAALASLARPQPGRARRPRARCSCASPGRGRGRLPDLDDLLGDPGAAQPARAGRGVGAPLHLARLRRDGSSRRPTRRAPSAEWG